MKRHFAIILTLMAAIAGLVAFSAVEAQPAGPTLTVPTDIPADGNSSVIVPIIFDPGDNDISSMVFSIDFDQSLLSIDPTDDDEDSVPDAISFNVPGQFITGVTLDLTDTQGELDFTIFDFAPPLSALPGGTIVEITFDTADVQGTVETGINFAVDPPPSFGNSSGQSVAGSVSSGSVIINPDGEVPTNTPTPTATNTPTATATATATGTPPTPTATSTPFAGAEVYLPLSLNDYPPTISGRVVLSNNSGVSGITVSTDKGQSAVTDSNGRYVITGLGPNTYVVAPTAGGYTFTPVNRTVTLPPGATNIDFLAIPLPTATPTATQPGYPGPDTPTPTATSPAATATATATHTPSPTPTDTPGGCWQGIVNGGFELNSGWKINNNEYPAAYSMVKARTGERSMRVGIINPADNRYSYSSVEQTVDVPAGATDAKLSFWLYPTSTGVLNSVTLDPPDFIPTNSTEGSMSYDAQYVLIIDQWNQQHTLLLLRSNSMSWNHYEFNAGSFAGQRIRVYFGVYNNGWGGVTGMYVDDVALISCNVDP